MRVAVLRILVFLAARWAVGWATFYFLSQILGVAGFPILSIMLNSMVLIKINFDLVYRSQKIVENGSFSYFWPKMGHNCPQHINCGREASGDEWNE